MNFSGGFFKKRLELVNEHLWNIGIEDKMFDSEC